MFSLRQSSSLDSYITEFSRLSLQVSEIDELSRGSLFTKGLCADIKRHVLTAHPVTLAQAIRSAHTAQQVAGVTQDDTTAEATDQPSHKLRPKWFGPFKVLQTIGTNAYRLDLPGTIRWHSAFNVAALRKDHKNSITDRHQPPPPPITDFDGNTRYMVEKILDDRIRSNQTQYLVKWKGYAAEDSRWEPELNLLLFTHSTPGSRIVVQYHVYIGCWFLVVSFFFTFQL